MKYICQFLFCCVILGVVQTLVGAFLVLFICSLLWGMFFRTKETIGFIAICCVCKFFQHYPYAGFAAAIFAIWAHSREKYAPMQNKFGQNIDARI